MKTDWPHPETSSQKTACAATKSQISENFRPGFELAVLVPALHGSDSQTEPETALTRAQTSVGHPFSLRAGPTVRFC